jgi:PIN like domain
MAAKGGVTFFFDENMPRRVADALREQLGESVTHLYHHFGAEGILDPEVLRFVGERGWFLVSRDRKILRRPHERRVIEEMGIGAFFLKDTLNDFCSIVRAIMHNWPEMKRYARTRERPFALLLRERGVVRLANRHIR